MSLTAALRPINLPFVSTISGNGPTKSHNAAIDAADRPFHLESKYLALSRMLVRFQHLILLTPSPNAQPTQDYELSQPQRQIQAELWSSLPYHRTKWLHNIDGARNLLLQLERSAATIKVQRAKKEAVQDLAEKRKLIKRLRNRIEEIGREVEGLGEKAWEMERSKDDELLGERADAVLARLQGEHAVHEDPATKSSHNGQNHDLEEGKPITALETENDGSHSPSDAAQRDVLLGTSSLRKRHHNTSTSTTKDPAEKPSTTSGFSNLPQTESTLSAQSATHDTLTTSLLSLATQLKQQTRAFEASLMQDTSLLDRAIEGLDKNVSGMELASRNVAFLRRMSEGEGWLGRIKLYAFIVGMWVAAILLVFVGPKLRF